MYAKIIISCGYELFCDKIEASFLVRSFGYAFFVFKIILKDTISYDIMIMRNK